MDRRAPGQGLSPEDFASCGLPSVGRLRGLARHSLFDQGEKREAGCLEACFYLVAFQCIEVDAGPFCAVWALENDDQSSPERTGRARPANLLQSRVGHEHENAVATRGGGP